MAEGRVSRPTATHADAAPSSLAELELGEQVGRGLTCRVLLAACRNGGRRFAHLPRLEGMASHARRTRTADGRARGCMRTASQLALGTLGVLALRALWRALMSKRPASSRTPSVHYLYVHGWGVGPEGAKCRLMRQHLPGETVHAFNWHVPSYAETTTTRALEELVTCMKAVGATWNVVGSSQGGYLAALLAQQNPELVQRLLLLAPSFDSFAGWVGLVQKQHPEWVPGTQCEPPPPLGPYNNTDDGSGGIGYAFVEDLRRYPPHPVVRCPAVVVHGLNDEEVDVAVSMAWVRHHARQGLPVSLHVLPDVDETQKIDHGLYHFAKPEAATFPTFQQLLQRHFV